MSRVGKAPVQVPESVQVSLGDGKVEVSGPRGSLEFRYPEEVEVRFADGAITVAPLGRDKRAQQMWGTSRTRIQNIVTGVTEGFERYLNIAGVGYRARAENNSLKLTLGFSHEVIYAAPEGVTVETPRPTEVRVSGIDRHAVGQAAAEIRRFRPPEPYNGKGISYRGEQIYRKSPRKTQTGV